VPAETLTNERRGSRTRRNRSCRRGAGAASFRFCRSGSSQRDAFRFLRRASDGGLFERPPGRPRSRAE
jgi:hypothetical protein